MNTFVTSKDESTLEVAPDVLIRNKVPFMRVKEKVRVATIQLEQSKEEVKVKKRFQSADHIYVKTIIHQIKSQLQNCCDIPREGKAKSPKLVKSHKRKETCNLLLHQLLKRLRYTLRNFPYSENNLNLKILTALHVVLL